MEEDDKVKDRRPQGPFRKRLQGHEFVQRWLDRNDEFLLGSGSEESSLSNEKETAAIISTLACGHSVDDGDSEDDQCQVRVLKRCLCGYEHGMACSQDPSSYVCTCRYWRDRPGHWASKSMTVIVQGTQKKIRIPKVNKTDDDETDPVGDEEAPPLSLPLPQNKIKCKAGLHDEEEKLIQGRRLKRPLCFYKMETKCERGIHPQVVECWRISDREQRPCSKIISETLACGHEATKSCYQKRIPHCLIPVPLMCKAGTHEIKTLACHVTEERRGKDLYCKEMVWKPLPCGHRIHVACSEKVGQCAREECVVGRGTTTGLENIEAESEGDVWDFVTRRLDCGHTIAVPSHLLEEDRVACNTVKKCAHGIGYLCDPDKRRKGKGNMLCHQPCTQTLPCGHKCQRDCHEADLKDFGHSSCCTLEQTGVATEEEGVQVPQEVLIRETEEMMPMQEGNSSTFISNVILFLVVFFAFVNEILEIIRRN